MTDIEKELSKLDTSNLLELEQKLLSKIEFLLLFTNTQDEMVQDANMQLYLCLKAQNKLEESEKLAVAIESSIAQLLAGHETYKSNLASYYEYEIDNLELQLLETDLTDFESRLIEKKLLSVLYSQSFYMKSTHLNDEMFEVIEKIEALSQTPQEIFSAKIARIRLYMFLEQYQKAIEFIDEILQHDKPNMHSEDLFRLGYRKDEAIKSLNRVTDTPTLKKKNTREASIDSAFASRNNSHNDWMRSLSYIRAQTQKIHFT